MFTLRKPSRDALQALRERHNDVPFSYPEIGSTRSPSAAGYVVDQNRVQLGNGPQTLLHARQALAAWRMLSFDWLEPCWPEALIAKGELVGTLANLCGVCWTANVCRIVYVLDEPDRFGFAYGTLRGHLLDGEERFLVEMLADGSVWFDIRAFSRPARWVARVGYPVVRGFQRRFARSAKAAMVRAISSPTPTGCNPQAVPPTG